MDNLRIRFVGFISDTTNYIVDIDNKEVLYKESTCTIFKKLTNRVTSFVNPINNSMVISFKLHHEESVAEVQLYPGCISHCTVSLTGCKTHNKEVLEKDFFNFDYFDYNNLLDKNGNVSTFVDYNEVFGLSEEELSLVFSHEESINFIKRIIENIQGQREFIEIIRGILTEVKSKITHDVEPLE